jgi:4-carboxymuconolactone decarboxylase
MEHRSEKMGGFVMRMDPRMTVWILAMILVPSVNLRAQDRMPPIPADKMTAAQKKASADYKAIRGSEPNGPPWAVILRSPSLLVPSLQIRMHYMNDSALDQRLTEFAIFIAARRWTNNFEFNAHTAAGLKAGVKQDLITAVAEGRRPEHMAEDEEILYDFCTELQSNQSVSDPTYARALSKFGEPGIVEMAGIEGYYTYLAMIMNAARITLPATAKPPLERFPRMGQGMAGAGLLSQSAPTGGASVGAKPIIDNERVSVSDVTMTPDKTGPAPLGRYPTVRTYVTGGTFTITHADGTSSTVTRKAGDVVFAAKGTADREVLAPATSASRVITTELKGQLVPPMKNSSGYPNAFPRPGSKKVFDNDLVVVWDYRWTPRVPTPMHFHDKDVVVTYLEDGDLSSKTPTGQVTVNEYKTGMTRFNARDRAHTEELSKGTQRAIIVELK